MGGRLIGHRGRQEDEWTWREKGRPGPGRPVTRLVAAAAVVGLAVIISVALFLVLREDGGGGAAPAPQATATQPPREKPPVRPGRLHMRLAVWDGRGWRSGDLDGGPLYREGETIPFMLRLDGAAEGETYELVLRYGCRAGEAAGFDFLTGYELEVGDAPALTAPGPGRARPDAAIPVPDDPAIPFDDGEGGLFRLWGASFQEVPLGPVPRMACQDEKLVVLLVRAHQERVFLLWGAHLAAAADWGEGSGAAGQEEPLTMRAQVPEASPVGRVIRILPGAVAP